ncbi:MAG: AbiV family abortive infection protein [Chitinophagaceae bacterium]|nr:MAG: AbiV family abortive infection protein [Chitinophagaceae bacterium]
MSIGPKEHSRFMEATAEQCATFYPVVIKNAERHYKTAQVIAASGDYANAVAHIVLSGEEFLKAVVLYLDSKELGIRKIPGIHKLFYQHVLRHNVIKMVFSVLQFLQTTKEGMKMGIPGTLLGLVKGYYKGRANKAWWNQADQLKLKAFYVDYTSTLSDPVSITETDYKTALLRGTDLDKSVKSLINYIESMTEQELNDFKESFHVTDIADLLEDTIGGLHD